MGRKINLTEQQINDICNFYIQGKSSIELAKMYNKKYGNEWYMYPEEAIKYGFVDEIVSDMDIIL